MQSPAENFQVQRYSQCRCRITSELEHIVRLLSKKPTDQFEIRTCEFQHCLRGLSFVSLRKTVEPSDHLDASLLQCFLAYMKRRRAEGATTGHVKRKALEGQFNACASFLQWRTLSKGCELIWRDK
jgi:hypothetical protein